MPSKAHASCGACRTRDTKLWWKAPKGLPTPVLCDACGISWRKYADLNHLRPIREEAAAAKQGKAEKREGTPLAGSNSKRVKVRVVFFLGMCVPVLSMGDWRRRPTGRFRLHHRRRQVMAPRNTVVSLVTSTVLVRSSSAKNVRRASILVSPDRSEHVTLHADIHILRVQVHVGLLTLARLRPGHATSARTKRPPRSRSYARPITHAVVTRLIAFRRTPIACSVLGPSASVTRRRFTHLPIRSCAFASQLRVRAGYTSPVRCSYPKYHSPTQSVCASLRASARFPLIAGLRCVEFFVPFVTH